MEADLTFTRSNELDVTQVEGNTERGIDFVDGWSELVMLIQDSGVILLRDVGEIVRVAGERGLSIEHCLIASERPST